MWHKKKEERGEPDEHPQTLTKLTATLAGTRYTELPVSEV